MLKPFFVIKHKYGFSGLWPVNTTNSSKYNNLLIIIYS